MDATDRVLESLDNPRKTGPDSYLARCPAHDDRSPSLSIKRADGRVLLHCFAGCEVGDVLAAIGRTLADLFDEPLSHHRPPLGHNERKRYGQALEAMKALRHELIVVDLATKAMRNGQLEQSDLQRLDTARARINASLELSGPGVNV